MRRNAKDLRDGRDLGNAWARRPGHDKGGFAVLTVLGLVLLILIYLVTVHGAIEQTRIQGQASARQQASAEKLTEAVTLALASEQAPANDEFSVAHRPLAAGDPLWAALPLLKPLPGDELLTVNLNPGVRDAAPAPTRLIINRQGRRPGPVMLDRAK